MLADGDLLVSRSGTIGRSLRYRAEVHGPCAYAGYLVRFVPAPIASADYLFHFTKSLAFADFIRVSAVSSTIENVNGDKYANMPLTLPPPAEQAAIVRFPDWATGRLERAIRAKRKVIALLHEQKQAIIHRAVTRGLDPAAVPLKPSGIPWLGRFRTLGGPAFESCVQKYSRESLSEKTTLGRQPMNIHTPCRERLRSGLCKLACCQNDPRDKGRSIAQYASNGAMCFMTEGGDPDKLGRGCVWDEQVSPCLHQNHIFAVRPNQSHLHPLFFYRHLMGTHYARAYFESTAKQTTNLASTNRTKIGQFVVLLPKIDEQLEFLPLSTITLSQ